MSKKQVYEFFDGFSWAVPTAFAETLAACRFEQGDVLYDTRRAYEGTWGQARPHVSHSIQVKLPLRRTGTKSEKAEESIFTDNWNMTVEFNLTDHRAGKTRAITTTQGRLYTLLWKGDLSSIVAKSPSPTVPTLPMDILRDLPKALDHVRGRLPEVSNGGVIFLMPFDLTRQLLRSKFRKVEAELAQFEADMCLVSPSDAGLESEKGFAPTVSIACFMVQSAPVNDVEKALKQALYMPAKNKKTAVERFRLGAHGHLATV